MTMTPRTEVTTITRDQYFQLVGLLTLAKGHNAALNGIRDAALKITGETEQMGHTGDAVFSDYPVDRILDRLEITVEGGTP